MRRKPRLCLCGCRPVLGIVQGRYRIECANVHCDMRGPFKATHTGAQDVWDRMILGYITLKK